MPKPNPAFDVVNELAQLENLRSPTAPQGGASSRQFRRYVVRGEARLQPMSRRSLDDTPLEIHLRDIGLGGIGFINSRPLPAGSVWNATFLRDGYGVGEHGITVRHCEQARPGVYLIGGQFIAGAGLLTLLGVTSDAVEAEFAGDHATAA